MRTTLDIDETLFQEARRLTDIRMKRRLVEAGLRALIRQQRLERLAGMLGRTRLAVTPSGLHRLRQPRTTHSHTA